MMDSENYRYSVEEKNIDFLMIVTVGWVNP